MPSRTLNIFQFQADLRAFADKVEKDLADVVVDIATDLFAKIVSRTPRDTGTARANWNISVGAPDLHTLPKTQYPEYHNMGDAEDQARAKAKDALEPLREAKHLEPIYIANDLPYINALEHGHSERQAPAGMVAVSVLEVEAEIASKVR